MTRASTTGAVRDAARCRIDACNPATREPRDRGGWPATAGTGATVPFEYGSSHSRELLRADGQPIDVLVVEGDPVLGASLTEALRQDGWQVHTAATGTDAERRARHQPPDIVIVDVALPDSDGLTVMHTLRTLVPDLPVILLTNGGSLEERVAGLAQGGDDCITKPFSLQEVALRVRGLVKRSGLTRDPNRGRLVVGDLTLDVYSHEVRRADVPIELTVTEFKLLSLLMRNPGRIVAKRSILREIWQCDFDRSPNIVELFIGYLRKKIDGGGSPMIHTVRGRGYVLRAG